MTQKILKVGSSAAVTIPKEFLKKLGWKIGDKVELHPTIAGSILIAKDRSSVVRDHQIMEYTQEFIEKYRGALKELADR